MKQHKGWCNTNIRCAVLHEDGICTQVRECDCGFEAASEQSESSAIDN